MAQTIRRVAVTGASGYLGRLLVSRLARCEGVERVLGIDIRPMPDDLSRSKLPPNVMFVERDITAGIADVLTEHRIEALAHLAFVIRPERNAERARRVNVGGAASVLSACAESGVRHVLYMSSATVYGAHADNPAMMTEQAPLRPARGFQYAEAKIEAEGMLAEFGASHPDVGVCILRACPVLGADADNFVARNFARRLLVAVAGYDPRMQFLHQNDAVEIMARCLLNRVVGTYNIGGRGAIRLSEMARIGRNRLVKLPTPLLYGAAELSWRLRLQSSSPACGLDFIRYPWVVSGKKLERDHGLKARYSSREAWDAFALRGNSWH